MSLYVMVSLAICSTIAILAAASPAGRGTHDRSADRRRTYVERNPASVNSMDIRTRLVADGVPRDQAGFITTLAAEHQIKPATMWTWLRHFDAESLAVVVAADVSHRELVAHMENGTVPNIEELKVFAGINGLEVAGPTVPAPTQAHTRKPVSGARKVAGVLPEIFEPGEWPAGVLVVPAEWSAAPASSARENGAMPRLSDVVREAMRGDEGRDGLAA